MQEINFKNQDIDLFFSEKSVLTLRLSGLESVGKKKNKFTLLHVDGVRVYTIIFPTKEETEKYRLILSENKIVIDTVKVKKRLFGLLSPIMVSSSKGYTVELADFASKICSIDFELDARKVKVNWLDK